MRKGFSMTELLVALAIILVLAGTITISANSMKISAKQEAERVATFLRRYIDKADKERRGFYFVVDEGKIDVYTDDDSLLDTLKANKNCTYSSIAYKTLIYNIKNKTVSSDVNIEGRNSKIKIQDSEPTETATETLFWIKVTDSKSSYHYDVITGLKKITNENEES